MSQTNFEDQNPYLQIGRLQREIAMLHAALEAEQAERKEYRREADRYREILKGENTILREALERIASTDITDDEEGGFYASSKSRDALNRVGGSDGT